MEAVFVHGGAFAVTVLSDAEDEVGNLFVLGFGFGLALAIGFLLFAVAFFRRHGHADDVIALLQIHATHAVSRATHGANAVFVEADGHSLVRSQKDNLLAVGEAGRGHLILLLHADGGDPAPPAVPHNFFHRPLSTSRSR